MNFLDLAKKRYSVRTYLNKSVEKEKLSLILDAGRVAPTAGNFQPQRLLVVESCMGLGKLRKAANIYNAPVAIVICCDKEAAWKRPQDGKDMVDIDASIVTNHLMHEATDLGLGTLWITWFDPQIVKQEFNLPLNYEPVNILLIGYAADEPLSPDRHSKTRKLIRETVFFEEF